MSSVKFDESKKGSELLKEDSYEENNVKQICYQENVKCVDNKNETDEQTDINKRGRRLGTTKENLEMQHRERLQEREAKLQEQGVRRSTRIQNNDTANEVIEDTNYIPKNFDEAIRSNEAKDWIEAMDKEINLLKSHNVWKLVTRPRESKIIKSKWIFTTKKNTDGTVSRKKARLVAVGTNQRLGIDFEESFSPVIKLESMRTLIAIAAHKHMKIRTYDVQTAYLHGEIHEDLYMEQPGGYEDEGGKFVCKLQKSIYGLPQSGRNWNHKINDVFVKIGLKRLETDTCIYYRKENQEMIIIGLYVDDQLVIGTSDKFIDETMDKLKMEFTMTENLQPESFLGVSLEIKSNIMLSQEKYVEQILVKFGLNDCKPTSTPGDIRQNLDEHTASKPVSAEIYQEMVGSLMYLSSGTRPDITYCVSRLSQYLKEPTEMHLTAVKRVYRYLKGTKDRKLVYDRKMGALQASADASWCSTKDAKSFSGYVMKLGTSTISWKCKKQNLVALSSCEAELISLCEAVRETKWLIGLLSELEMGDYVKTPILIYSDSRSAIEWIKGTGSASRTKHINRKYYFIRDEYRRGNIEIKHCATEEMEADFLTKNVPTQKINECNNLIQNIVVHI